MKFNTPITISLFFTFLFCAANVLAGTSATRAIGEFTVLQDGAIELYVSPATAGWNNTEGCANSAKKIVLPPAHPYYSELYAATFSAFLQARQIRATLDGCYTTPSGSEHPAIDAVIVY